MKEDYFMRLINITIITFFSLFIFGCEKNLISDLGDSLGKSSKIIDESHKKINKEVEESKKTDASTNVDSGKKEIDNIDTQAKRIGEASDLLKSTTNDANDLILINAITQSVNSINDSVSKLNKEMEEIKRKSKESMEIFKRILAHNTEIGNSSVKIAKDSVNVTDLQKKNEEMAKRLEDMERSDLRKIIMIVCFICFLGIGAGIYIAIGLKEFTQGLAIAITFLVLLSIAMAIRVYLEYFLIGGAILLTGLIGYVIYVAVQKKNVITDLVYSQEKYIKPNMEPEIKSLVYGSEKDTGLLFNYYDDRTYYEVKKVKDELRKNGEI